MIVTERKLHSQTGVGLIGLIVFAAVVGYFGILASKAIPSYLEYNAIKRAMSKIEVGGDTDAASARKSFERFADVDRIETLKPADINFVKGPRGMRGLFEYETRIPVVGNMSLVFEYKND